MSTWMLPLVYGAIGYLIATAVHSVLTRAHIPKVHQQLRERIMELLHRRLHLAAETADLDQELAEIWEKAPDKQAILIVETVEEAHTLAPALLRLAQKFGFAVPDASLTRQRTWHQPPPPMSSVDSIPPPAAEVEATLDVDAWGNVVDPGHRLRASE